MNENKVYRVAIVGLGRMGSTIDKEMPPGTPPVSIAAACQASERLEVVTGADIDAVTQSPSCLSNNTTFAAPELDITSSSIVVSRLSRSVSEDSACEASITPSRSTCEGVMG